MQLQRLPLGLCCPVFDSLHHGSQEVEGCVHGRLGLRGVIEDIKYGSSRITVSKQYFDVHITTSAILDDGVVAVEHWLLPSGAKFCFPLETSSALLSNCCLIFRSCSSADLAAETAAAHCQAGYRALPTMLSLSRRIIRKPRCTEVRSTSGFPPPSKPNLIRSEGRVETKGRQWNGTIRVDTNEMREVDAAQHRSSERFKYRHELAWTCLWQVNVQVCVLAVEVMCAGLAWESARCLSWATTSGSIPGGG